jgi:hypothetical protein
MLPHDFDLTNAHLQALSSREAIVAFCAQLGYNTEARLKQTSAALGFSDVLTHEVTHVERVADHENGELQVYLLEMKHVTVALTQALARSLRNRAGNFLLVLTADYERIDFVLMDLVRPEGSAGGIGLKAAFLRPRTLTLERRNPSLVDVRVLRRFSYTESDVYYQIDKLRSAYGVAEWSEPFFNNRALFSDYYLNERLLNWLEAALKISPDKNGNTGLDVLTGKSRLRNYLGDYQKGEGELAFEDVVDILHKNRTKIGISLSEARIMARLRTEYEKSVETLKPLKAQLAWTDGVIDQIVYRLYGLTTEEIDVVEGKK